MDINELETYRLSDAVKFNSELNPRLWGSDQHLRLDVREQLLKIASDFREFLGVNDLDLKDITISGSNAAYSYTPHSDIDLHLVVDIPDDPIYQELFTAKKYQYNDEYNFKIGPYDIELYVQDSKQPHASQGIYSIKDNKWLSVPRRRQPDIDDISVRSKYEDLGHRIDSAIEDADLKKLDDIANKIKEMRKAGLAQTGEFGPENLAFKILRNNGTLDRLHAARLQAKSQAYSIKERKKPKFKYGNFGFLGVLNTSPEQTDVEVAESVKQPDIIAELNSFVKFCAGWLELGALPGVRYKKDPAWSERNKTFGRYDEQTNTLYVSLTNRHLLDIMRTVAHELTHHKQNEHNDLTPLSGSTGSHQENEANSLAGQIMRDYADERPDLFQYNINESIKNRLAAAAAAACIAGTPGCATVAPAVKDIQTVGRTVQTMKGYGAAGARDELTQRFKDELRRRQGQVVPEDYDADHPPGPETKPTMPKGTVRVDVSDMYDWYKLGKDISNLKAADKSQFGKGPPSTIISFGDEDTEHKYIKDLEKLGLTTTDIDPIDKNQPPGMKRQKVDPTYNVNESLNQPYKLKWYPGDWDEVTAYADLPDGNDLTIIFNNDENEEGEEAWSVEFYRNDSQEITGEGDKFRIFATVLDAIKKFIRNPKYKPNRIIFSASKEVKPGQKIQSRANLYDTLVQRYARALGFKAFRADAGNKVHYELSRINKGVAEGAMKDLDIDIQDQQWDAVVGYVVNGVKKGMDTDRMELALYKWASGELVDVEQALEDHGFRDIADLADHIEQHNGRYVPPRDFGLSKIGKGLTEASGYIPVNSKEARDPRYSMAITQDIQPGEVQRQARKMGFQTTAAGIPPTLRTSGKL